MSTMWNQGTEKRVPKGAKIKFACQGTYRGSYGAWMSVYVKGECVGLTFRAGYQHRVPKGEKSKLQYIPDLEPYVDIAMPGRKVIGGRKQRRDFIRAHGLIEVGNENPQTHPRDVADARRERPDPAIVESLKRNSGGRWL